MQRKLKDITKEEIAEVNNILRNEYYYSPIKSCDGIAYQCFTKSHSIFSGIGVVKVYKYLKSVGIDLSIESV